MNVGCVILNYNDSGSIIKIINMIKGYQLINDIIIVDNHSTDDSVDKLRLIENKHIHLVVNPKNGGYGYGNNKGIIYSKKNCNCDYAIIANPDIIFSEECLEILLNTISEDEKCGVVSAVQYNLNGEKAYGQCWDLPQKRDMILGSGLLGKKFLRKMRKKIDYSQRKYQTKCVPGSMLLVDVNKFLECQGYDEDMFLYEEESTLGWRMNAKGYDTYLCTRAKYIHAHSISINKSIPKYVNQYKILLNSRKVYLKKYLKSNRYEMYLISFYFNLILLELRVWKKIGGLLEKTHE